MQQYPLAVPPYQLIITIDENIINYISSNAIMIKTFSIISCLLLISGCNPHTKYTTHNEHVEEHVWNKEKGIVKCYEDSCKFSWEN